jgi:hypothetical protein
MTDDATTPLKDLERRRLDAVSTGDLAALAELFSDDFFQVTADGKAHDKAANISREKGVPRRIEPRSPRIRIFADVAVLTGEMVERVSKGEQVQTNRLYVTQVAVKESDGKWRYVSVQATRIP